MIDYNQIKETLRSQIWTDLGRFFVDLENGDPRPDNQDNIDTFISHKFTTPYVEQAGYETSESTTLTRVNVATMTLSLTVYSSDKGTALNTAHELKRWFRFHGYEYLKEHDLIVQSIEPMQDRTTFLETDYDQRCGFDVILRTTDEATRSIEIIERAEVNGDIIGGE
ncbi:hypothetical protein SAMN05192534_12366 [Alteribacillus persepolensis]|uniref:Phage neck terminator protein gp12-like domain-containing protein n=1 Tax=Alteribacillus persepolensis TaxID=568899 RepID=A0A1G8IBL3_9BACI|nr:hypothetical protein [Alteribacillus persepolensis]SDI15950.1 hypothetical protein SAMN05192534_12366 [Alteribacillus persepolensis]